MLGRAPHPGGPCPGVSYSVRGALSRGTLSRGGILSRGCPMGGGILWGCLIQALSSLGGAIPAKGRQAALRPDCGQATGDAVTEALAVTGRSAHTLAHVPPAGSRALPICSNEFS